MELIVSVIMSLGKFVSNIVKFVALTKLPELSLIVAVIITVEPDCASP